MNPSAPEPPAPRGVPRALAAHAVLALAALGVAAVSLGLAGVGPSAVASVTDPLVGRQAPVPAEALEAAAEPATPAPAPAPGKQQATAPEPASEPAPLAPPVRSAPTPDPATVAPVRVEAPAGVVEHRVEDGLGGRGRVRWTTARSPAISEGTGSPAAPAAPAEADLTTRPVPRPAAGRLRTGSFFGLPAGWRTVYLVDASGSLIDTLPFVQRELERSLLSLDPSQSYAVLLFQDGQVVAAPPGRMAPAGREQTRRTASFVSPEAGNLFPAGRADAAAALEAALAMKPDAVVLLSDHVEGRLSPERTRSRLVALARAAAPGTAIHTVQFVDEPRVPADGGMPTLPLMSALTGGTHRFVGFSSQTR